MSDVDGRFACGGFVLGDIANMLMECGVPVTNFDGTFFDDGPYNGKLLILEAVLPCDIRVPLQWAP